MSEWIVLDGVWTDGYNALTVPCPRCGDDAIFHLGVAHGVVTATLAERPCGCRITTKQLLGCGRAGQRASEGSMTGEITNGMRVVAKADKYDPPIRIGTVLRVYQGQYHAWDKTFARVEWTYQRRYLGFVAGETRRATMQTKALRPYEAA